MPTQPTGIVLQSIKSKINFAKHLFFPKNKLYFDPIKKGGSP
jgi:hypothetical protein